MTIFLTVLHVMVCLVLVIVVLLQHGKGADIGAVFGGGASSTVFGSRGAGNFLTKLTTGVGADLHGDEPVARLPREHERNRRDSSRSEAAGGGAGSGRRSAGYGGRSRTGGRRLPGSEAGGARHARARCARGEGAGDCARRAGSDPTAPGGRQRRETLTRGLSAPDGFVIVPRPRSAAVAKLVDAPA